MFIVSILKFYNMSYLYYYYILTYLSFLLAQHYLHIFLLILLQEYFLFFFVCFFHFTYIIFLKFFFTFFLHVLHRLISRKSLRIAWFFLSYEELERNLKENVFLQRKNMKLWTQRRIKTEKKSMADNNINERK